MEDSVNGKLEHGWYMSRENLLTKERKKVQKLKAELKLIVDVPKTGGNQQRKETRLGKHFLTMKNVSKFLDLGPTIHKRLYTALCVLSCNDAFQPKIGAFKGALGSSGEPEQKHFTNEYSFFSSSVS